MPSGHPSFDHTIQKGNIWLKAVVDRLHFEERRHTYSSLRAVLHALRDRLTLESSVHLGAQMLIVIGGLYNDGWRLAGKPVKDHTIDESGQHVVRELPLSFPMDTVTVTRGVFEVMFEQLDPGEAKIIDQMLVALRNLWPAVALRG